jgi:beta-lactamase superfamily II metal-dependent hydrolase
MGKLEIKIYKVKCGDCFYIRYISDKKVINIFIDAGYAGTYKKTFRNDVKDIIKNGEKIDLFVITHIDQDHIKGMTPFIKEFGIDIIEELWFNHPEKFEVRESNTEINVSVKQGINLRDYFQSRGRNITKVMAMNEFTLFESIKFQILSPNQKALNKFQNDWEAEERQEIEKKQKRQIEIDVSSTSNDYNKSVDELISTPFNEDDDSYNGSSIAFLLSVGKFQALFCADAHPSIIYESLERLRYTKTNPLKIDFLKVSHHGSKKNLSNELLSVLNCQNFVFSANGINRDNLPNKETLARIVKDISRNQEERLYLYFNDDNQTLQNIRTLEEEKLYNFECKYAQSNTNHLKISYDGNVLQIE